jgi:hypothetical protein
MQRRDGSSVVSRDRVEITRNQDVAQQAYESLSVLAEWATAIGKPETDYIVATVYDVLGMLFVTVEED